MIKYVLLFIIFNTIYFAQHQVGYNHLVVCCRISDVELHLWYIFAWWYHISSFCSISI